MLIWYLIADYCRGSQIAEGAADLGAGFDATDLVAADFGATGFGATDLNATGLDWSAC